LFPDHHIPFLEDYILRLLNSAEILQQPWIPEIELINQRIEEYIAESGITDGLIRICIFDESLAISDRPAKSNGTPVKGWLLEYRRPVPTAKSTEEKDLYGRLSELNVPTKIGLLLIPKIMTFANPQHPTLFSLRVIAWSYLKNAFYKVLYSNIYFHGYRMISRL
jgi:hypothetical protein